MMENDRVRLSIARDTRGAVASWKAVIGIRPFAGVLRQSELVGHRMRRQMFANFDIQRGVMASTVQW